MLLWITMVAHATSMTLLPEHDVAALTAQLQPGDTVTFMDGTYTLDAPLEWGFQGTEAKPVTLRAAPGAHPVFQVTYPGYAFALTDARYVTLDGLGVRGGAEGVGGVLVDGALAANLTLTNLSATGLQLPAVRISTKAQFIEVRGLSVDSGALGLVAGCADGSCWLQDSVIADGLFAGLTDADRSAIELLGGPQGVTISDNVVANVAGGGVAVSSTAAGDPTRVVGNTVWRAGGNGITVGSRAVVQNNLIAQVSGEGLVVQDLSAPLARVEIGFNTIYGATVGAHLRRWDQGAELAFIGNAVIQATGVALRVESPGTPSWADATFVGNVLGGTIEGPAPSVGFDLEGSVADLQDAEVGQLAPSASSRLIAAAADVAEELAPGLDWTGATRVRPHDAGALMDGSQTLALAAAKKVELLVADLPEDTGLPDDTGASPSGCSAAPKVPGHAAWFALAILCLGRRHRREGLSR